MKKKEVFDLAAILVGAAVIFSQARKIGLLEQKVELLRGKLFLVRRVVGPISYRRDIPENWEESNPVVAKEEIGVILMQPKMYVKGDGKSPFKQLKKKFMPHE